MASLIGKTAELDDAGLMDARGSQRYSWFVPLLPYLDVGYIRGSCNLGCNIICFQLSTPVTSGCYGDQFPMLEGTDLYKPHLAVTSNKITDDPVV